MSKLSEMMDNLSPARDEDGHPITQIQWDELRKQLSTKQADRTEITLAERDPLGNWSFNKEYDQLRQQLAEACGLLGGSSEWIRFGSTQERSLYAKIQKFLLDNQ